MLISIEGIDGSGKSTVWEALQGTFDDGFTYTREPTDSWYGDAVRRSVADDDADPLAELFLYTADHAAHLASTVRPALADGDVVVTDRYVDSRYAYQGAALEGTIREPLQYVVGVHQPFTVEPDLTILLEVDPERGVARSGATDKFEQRAFLADVARNYDFLARRESERFVRIDADRSPEDVISDAEQAVADALTEAAGADEDGGPVDGGSTHGGSADGGSADGGSTHGGSADGGSADGGSSDRNVPRER